ncbi:hypothetical protein U1Q18_002369, partial [Sarracenia purpurea var. burkii]
KDVEFATDYGRKLATKMDTSLESVVNANFAIQQQLRKEYDASLVYSTNMNAHFAWMREAMEQLTKAQEAKVTEVAAQSTPMGSKDKAPFFQPVELKELADSIKSKATKMKETK